MSNMERAELNRHYAELRRNPIWAGVLAKHDIRADEKGDPIWETENLMRLKTGLAEVQKLIANAQQMRGPLAEIRDKLVFERQEASSVNANLKAAVTRIIMQDMEHLRRYIRKVCREPAALASVRSELERQVEDPRNAAIQINTASETLNVRREAAKIVLKEFEDLANPDIPDSRWFAVEESAEGSSGSSICWNCESAFSDDGNATKCPHCGADATLGPWGVFIAWVVAVFVMGALAGAVYWLLGSVTGWWGIGFVEAILTFGFWSAATLGVVAGVFGLWSKQQARSDAEVREKGEQIKRDRKRGHS